MASTGEGPDFWTALMAVLTGVGGGLLGIWRAAAMVEKTKQEMKFLRDKLVDTEDDIKKIDNKTDNRHEANQNWMREVAARMATKDDIRALEALMRSLFGGHR